MKRLVPLFVAFTFAGCASSQGSERHDALPPPSTAEVQPVVPPAPGTPAVKPPPGGTAQAAPSQAVPQAAQLEAERARAQSRLQDAQRELQVAKTDRSAADAEGARAQADMAAATRAMDSVARAHATELTRSAELRARVADAHLEYANKLVAARQADIEAADLAAKVWQLSPGPQSARATATSTGAQTVDPQLVQTRQAADSARARARDLGQAALAAQRRWEQVSRQAQALAAPRPPPGPAASGNAPDTSTGSGGTGAASQEPVTSP